MRIALLGCKGTTLDLLDVIRRRDSFKVDLVVTLPETIALANHVAFYRGQEIATYCANHQIPVHMVQSYNLEDEDDRRFFREASVDLLMVLGWERLIPPFVLHTLGKMACGMHGSPYGLPRGRGRSPLNWSILKDHTRFLTFLIKYSPFVDDGEVIGFKAFSVNDFDTIASLHMKNRIAMYQLLELYVPLIESGRLSLWPQPPEGASYYPKRVPDDGAIDWRQKTREIYNQIRALSPPYPPAFCWHRGTKLFITEAYPFDEEFYPGTEPGTIVDLSISQGHFVVKTSDGSLLVKGSLGPSVESLNIGDVLEGASQDDIMRAIRERYPDSIPADQREI